MKVTITAKKMQIAPAFNEYAEKRLASKLGKFFGDEADAKITLTEFKNQIILELTVKYNSMIYRAEQLSDDKNDALDAVIDKIIRQIRKNKTKIEKRLKDSAFKQNFTDTVPEQDNYEVIKHKKFEMRPMDPEEAVMQMELVGHEFFVFLNSQNDKVSVVYKRKNGNYGLIEPEN